MFDKYGMNFCFFLIIGTSVTIVGTGLGAEEGALAISDTYLDVVSWEDTQIIFSSPAVQPGDYTVQVQTADGGCAINEYVCYNLSKN